MRLLHSVGLVFCSGIKKKIPKWNKWIASSTIGDEKTFLGSFNLRDEAKEKIVKWT